MSRYFWNIAPALKIDAERLSAENSRPGNMNDWPSPQTLDVLYNFRRSCAVQWIRPRGYSDCSDSSVLVVKNEAIPPQRIIKGENVPDVDEVSVEQEAGCKLSAEDIEVR